MLFKESLVKRLPSKTFHPKWNVGLRVYSAYTLCTDNVHKMRSTHSVYII